MERCSGNPFARKCAAWVLVAATVGFMATLTML